MLPIGESDTTRRVIDKFGPVGVLNPAAGSAGGSTNLIDGEVDEAGEVGSTVILAPLFVKAFKKSRMPCIPALLTSLNRLFDFLSLPEPLLETVSTFDFPDSCRSLNFGFSMGRLGAADSDAAVGVEAGAIVPSPAGREKEVGRRFSGDRYGLAVNLLGTGEDGALFSATLAR